MRFVENFVFSNGHPIALYLSKETGAKDYFNLLQSTFSTLYATKYYTQGIQIEAIFSCQRFTNRFMNKANMFGDMQTVKAKNISQDILSRQICSFK